MLTPTVVLDIGLVLSGIASFLMPKGTRPAGFFAGLFITFGVNSLVSGRIVQDWEGGPPVEGPLAVVFSLVLIGIGIYLIVFALIEATWRAAN